MCTRSMLMWRQREERVTHINKNHSFRKYSEKALSKETVIDAFNSSLKLTLQFCLVKENIAI